MGRWPQKPELGSREPFRQGQQWQSVLRGRLKKQPEYNTAVFWCMLECGVPTFPDASIRPDTAKKVLYVGLENPAGILRNFRKTPFLSLCCDISLSPAGGGVALADMNYIYVAVTLV